MTISPSDTPPRRSEVVADLRRQWLLAHPEHVTWLLSHGDSPTYYWSKDARANLITEELRSLGIYSRRTMVSDICSALRNAARRLSFRKEEEPSPTDQALETILAILARPAVDRATILHHLNTL
jgi:hypothetical protein